MNNIEGTRQNDFVTSGEEVPFLKRRHKTEGNDCLIKTQDSAKSVKMMYRV